VPKPEPSRDEVVVQVKAEGVSPWNVLIRSGRSALARPLPLALGSDLSGIVTRRGHEILKARRKGAAKLS